MSDDIHPRILQAQIDALRQEVRASRSASELGGGGREIPPADASWRSSVDRALGELKGAIDGLRHSFSILAGAVGLLAAIMLAGFAFLGNQLAQVSTK
jgi:hypothetical protein